LRQITPVRRGVKSRARRCSDGVQWRRRVKSLGTAHGKWLNGNRWWRWRWRWWLVRRVTRGSTATAAARTRRRSRCRGRARDGGKQHTHTRPTRERIILCTCACVPTQSAAVGAGKAFIKIVPIYAYIRLHHIIYAHASARYIP